ncbi:MAG: FitA-like ribbon-helix-helix domain-containing protein [Candidatus Binataceae bacterium]
MFVTLTIKKVPTQVVKRIKERAAANHRSLQGELSAILEQTARGLSYEQALAGIERRGLRSRGNSTAIIRKARDARPRG